MCSHKFILIFVSANILKWKDVHAIQTNKIKMQFSWLLMFWSLWNSEYFFFFSSHRVLHTILIKFWIHLACKECHFIIRKSGFFFIHLTQAFDSQCCRTFQHRCRLKPPRWNSAFGSLGNWDVKLTPLVIFFLWPLLPPSIPLFKNWGQKR